MKSFFLFKLIELLAFLWRYRVTIEAILVSVSPVSIITPVGFKGLPLKVHLREDYEISVCNSLHKLKIPNFKKSYFSFHFFALTQRGKIEIWNKTLDQIFSPCLRYQLFFAEKNIFTFISVLSYFSLFSFYLCVCGQLRFGPPSKERSYSTLRVGIFENYNPLIELFPKSLCLPIFR